MLRVACRLSKILPVAALLLAGCASGRAPTTASEGGMSAGNAKLSVKMAESIFLQPVAPSERTIYLKGHNTSSAQDLGLEKHIRQNLVRMGYRIVDNPDKAHYMLMWNTLYIGEETQPYLVKEAALHSLQGALVGGATGAVVGAAAKTSDIKAGGTAGALIGAGVGALTGAYLTSNHYMMVVDIQTQERQEGAVATSTTSLKQGIDNKTVATSGSVEGWGIYRDRVVAQASGLRLNFPYVRPALVKETAGAITGLF